MHNLKSLRLILPLLALLLTGCASNSTGSSVSAPAIPPLGPESRQGPALPLCSPTCLKKWNEKAEQWRKRLNAVE